jgi:triosephosphate isomerase
VKFPLIIANWKANLTLKEAEHWLTRAVPHLKALAKTEVVICPSFITLPLASEQIKDTHLYLGSQNVSQFPHGKYTGEVPVELLQGLVRYALVGHSERRKYFEESNQIIAQKVSRLVEYRIKPVVCVENEKDITELSDLIKTRDLVVAYEPTFAIGTGTPDTPENAQKVAQTIRLHFSEAVTVLYGGSVTEENIENYLKQPDIGGSLVGGASLNPEDFVALTRKIEG